jgi:hypothetical protein
VAHIYNPSTREPVAGGCREFEASLGYTVKTCHKNMERQKEGKEGRREGKEGKGKQRKEREKRKHLAPNKP